MRCIATQTLELHSLEGWDVPRQYAIISSCWEPEELSFQNLCTTPDVSQVPGVSKLKSACQKAQLHGIKWLWSPNSCVNHQNQEELAESIKSSSQVFKNSTVCLVYLHDLSIEEEPFGGWETALRRCQWMHRAWTLHEIIFAKRIEFYNRDWVMIGTKDSLLSPLSDITRVDQSVLQDPERLMDFSVGYKMSWAASLIATHIEDVAYSLIAIFDVTLSITYGEGDRAFLRLQDEIAKVTDDGTLFAWQSNGLQQYRGIFAKCPSEFSFMSYTCKTPLRIRGNMRNTDDGIYLKDVFSTYKAGEGIVLAMWPDQSQYGTQGLGIVLSKQNGRYVRYMPHRTLDISHVPLGLPEEIFLDSGIQQQVLEHMAAEPEQTPKGFNDPTSSFEYFRCEKSEAGDMGYLRDMDPRINSAIPSLHPGGNTESEIQDWQPEINRIPSKKRSSDYIYTLADADEEFKAMRRKQFTDYQNITLYLHGDLIHGHREDRKCDDDGEINNASRSVEHINTDLEAVTNTTTEMLGTQALVTGRPDLEASSSDENLLACIRSLKEIGLEKFFSWATETSRYLPEGLSNDLGLHRLRKRLDLALNIDCWSINCDSDPEDDQTAIVSTPPYRGRLFACPFYFQDPNRHISCLKTATMASIEEVITHVSETHRRPCYCPICGSIFERYADRDAHILARSCTRSALPDVGGASYIQIHQITNDLSPLHTKEVKWYEIWDILFPDEKQPDQPYLWGEVDRAVCLMKDYWFCHGHEIVSEFIKNNMVPELDAESVDCNALGALVLDRMMDAIIE